MALTRLIVNNYGRLAFIHALEGYVDINVGQRDEALAEMENAKLERKFDKMAQFAESARVFDNNTNHATNVIETLKVMHPVTDDGKYMIILHGCPMYIPEMRTALEVYIDVQVGSIGTGLVFRGGQEKIEITREQLAQLDKDIVERVQLITEASHMLGLLDDK